MVADLLLLPLILSLHSYRQERVHVALQVQHHAVLRLLAIQRHLHVRLHHHARQHLPAELACSVHTALRRQQAHAVAREVHGAHVHASHATGLEELLSPQIATLQLDDGEEAGDLVEEAEEDTAVAQLLHHADHLVTRMDRSQVTDHRRVLLQQRTLVGTHERVLVRQHTHHTHTQLLPHREGLTWVLHRSQLAHVLRIQHSTDL